MQVPSTRVLDGTRVSILVFGTTKNYIAVSVYLLPYRSMQPFPSDVYEKLYT